MAYPADWPFIGYRADKAPPFAKRPSKRVRQVKPKIGPASKKRKEAQTAKEEKP